MRILLTGVAGFIGFHLARALVNGPHTVLAIDSLNDYYNPELKTDRLAALGAPQNLAFHKVDIVDAVALDETVDDFCPEVIINLAAQAGVRYSLVNPGAYADANVRGLVNLLELARRTEGFQHFIYASSSSVYGQRKDGPFREADPCDDPVSLYAATKRAGELICQSYANLYGLSLTGLRFFTVYGAWGRPDMAYWIFADAILRGETIKLFNEGNMRRDFTHVSDVVAGIERILAAPAKPGNEIYNIGQASPVLLKTFLEQLEADIGKKATVELVPMQPGDVSNTYADVSKLTAAFGYQPKIGIAEGLKDFVDWYRAYAKL